MSGWLLLTTFYFIFWARTSSADMLNMAGSLCAVAWYFQKRDKPAAFVDYMIFFFIIMLTSLCKGLVGAIVPIIAVGADVLLQQSWKQHLRFSVLFAALLSAIIYIIPFWASSHFNGGGYNESGLYLVYRENILRYFQPFDHQGPIYTYFIYLPVYLLPWTIFLAPALFSLFTRWETLPLHSKWIAWTLLALFIFFTMSGSRRSYYVLPMVPFAILFIADWMLTYSERSVLSGKWMIASFVLLLLICDVLPAWYYTESGMSRFAALVKNDAIQVKPWQEWNVVMLDAESKLNFYLELPPTAHNFQIKGDVRTDQTEVNLLKAWPILINPPANTIFVSRKLYAPILQHHLNHYRMIELPKSHLPFFNKHDTNVPIAFIPLS